MNRKILGLVVGGVFVVVAFLLVARQPSSSSSQPKPTPSIKAQPTSAPTVQPDIQQAIDVANSFTFAYFTYDWQQPPNMATILRPYTTDRLYSTLITDGTAPDGSNVPWGSVRPDLHETDKIQVNKVVSQEPSDGQASIQQTVSEISNTDLGHSETVKEVDLSLQKQNGTWVVDWVSERKAQQ